MVPSSRADSDVRQSTKRGRRIACRQCRQAKIRCELSPGGTPPCSRCQRMDQSCEIDTGFKRINKRVRLDELENEVRQLRSSVSTFPTSPPRVENPSPGQGPVRGFPGMADATALYSVHEGSLSSPSKSLNEGPAIVRPSSSPANPRSLNHVRLSSPQIDTLFSIFFDRYHPFVPLLDPTTSANDYFNKCPLLFWVIIYISSRQYADEPSLATALAAPLKSLLWEMISNPPHTWHIVQSISLLCMWPFPTSSLSTDTTPILVNTAQTIAMQLGLHQPESIQDFSRTKKKLTPAEISEVVRTWSVCYVASQSIFTNYGMALVSSDWMIDHICDENNDYLVPDVLKHQLLIYRFSGRVNNYMSSPVPRTSGLSRSQDSMSALGILEQEFMDIFRSLSGNLTAENEILLSGTGLQLYVFYLLDNGSSLARKMGLVRAFDLAKSLILKLQQLDSRMDFIKYCPVSYSRAATLAALFILRLEDSNFAGVLDEESAKRAFNAALSLLRRASLEDNDLPGRTSKILAQLWSVQGQSPQSHQEPRLKLRTRLAASLLHDQLWNWRESFGGQGSASHTPPVESSQDAPVNAISEADTLPIPSEGHFSFDEIFDAELLSLLPFDLDTDMSFEPTV